MGNRWANEEKRREAGGKIIKRLGKRHSRGRFYCDNLHLPARLLFEVPREERALSDVVVFFGKIKSVHSLFGKKAIQATRRAIS